MLTLSLPLLRGVCNKISLWSKIAKDEEAEEPEVWSAAPSRLMACVSPGMVRRTAAAAAGLGTARGGGRFRADSPDVVTDAQRYEREMGRGMCGGCERVVEETSGEEETEEEESEEEVASDEEESEEEESEEEESDEEDSDEGSVLTSTVKEIMMRAVNERTR